MRQWTVDAFAPEAFKGNPACVVEPFDAWPDAGWMQKLAAENNQAETAFLLRTDDPARFGLRWFTPALEVPLCGHATLASGHVLFEELGLDADLITFDTQSGPLTVRRAGELYEMDFPAQPPQRCEVAGLAEALGVAPVEVWASNYVIAVLADEAAVRAVAPDLMALEKVAGAHTGSRGNVGVAALADAGRPYDVVDRFFAPGSGIPEDPATGSLHCILAPLFAEKLGRPRVVFHQAYPGRGGDLDCEHRGDRVLLRGRATTVVDATLRIRP
ncbi:PhzF family phenazine biosynthesis protein [Phenylobacterium sp. J367]|uniref:PhzF family phenazine biosynthesis protein n=1 Tax=Phenylobacterium sp. J367 TaxID=2898435 RepID=UPI002150BB5D|nr:PhzF family phenazine biosynthesis protein [Phenylobacterium sp. J367]MCR5877962.1 PhzF family phenazine biosynthesis protein [Phenylobacterium sp. J367]